MNAMVHIILAVSHASALQHPTIFRSAPRPHLSNLLDVGCIQQAGVLAAVPAMTGQDARCNWRLATTQSVVSGSASRASIQMRAASLPASPKEGGVQQALGLLALAAVLVRPALALASGGATEHVHLGQKIALFFQQTGFPDWVVLMLISATPAVELRGGVPVGNWMGLSPALTFAICVVGNMLPIAPTLLALRSPFVKRLAAPLLARAEKKLAGLPKGQSRTLALTLFVGVPAPGTGAWTGAIIAYLLDMPFTTAMSAIFAGVVLAGAIMTVLTLAGKVGAIIALAALIAGGLGAIFSASKAEQAESDEAE
mmetsp:Transcript_32987/g.72481  ORF Transcript_32987/g.72481 Transcript_32987/m.72481 type:complete len:312 (+) Transcript_32987:182-1117(+)